MLLWIRTNVLIKGRISTEKYFLIYFAVISLITVIITAYDKRAAKKNPRKRVPEKVLLALAFCGGSLAELLTMLKIRHKTKKLKFMVGLPVILLLQAVIIFVIFKFILI